MRKSVVQANIFGLSFCLFLLFSIKFLEKKKNAFLRKKLPLTKNHLLKNKRNSQSLLEPYLISKMSLN